MNPSFLNLMSEATRLTRAGNLEAATAAIRAALGGVAPSRAPAAAARDDSGRVIDVEARVMAADADADASAEAGADASADAQFAPRAAARESAKAGRFIDGSYANQAGGRAYKLYVPPGFRGQSLPLVVMLHGCTQNADDFAAGTGMNRLAGKRDFFVLYPEQARKANRSGCWNWFKHNHQQAERGEPAVLAGMTRDIMRRYGTDPARVYVAGLSAGGAMAAILGQTHGDLYAAVGVHSGLPRGAASDVQGAFSAMKTGAQSGRPASSNGGPAIVFHGDRDLTVHPRNGEQVVAACVGGAAPEEERGMQRGRSYTRRSWRDASGRVVAEHWLVHGAGHAWSGGSTDGSYADSNGPDASEQMLRFFFANPLRPLH